MRAGPTWRRAAGCPARGPAFDAEFTGWVPRKTSARAPDGGAGAWATVPPSTPAVAAVATAGAPVALRRTRGARLPHDPVAARLPTWITLGPCRRGLRHVLSLADVVVNLIIDEIVYNTFDENFFMTGRQWGRRRCRW